MANKDTGHKREECDPTFHRYFALEPILDPATSALTIILVCTNCGKPRRYDLNLSKREATQVIE